jgi:hypothetical protein
LRQGSQTRPQTLVAADSLRRNLADEAASWAEAASNGSAGVRAVGSFSFMIAIAPVRARTCLP